ncbi:MAG TPA: ABC transporter ATP-binding protein [Syntrophorhabdales bacterium]|nr:ABC transporter ATP-binding protein [Syntrophorhabdales bacterium]
MMLSVEKLSVYYGAIQALKEVSMEVEEKEIVSVLGANGAGKSTLLMSISGILPSRQGRVMFDNDDITRQSPSAIVRLGISQVPEGRDVFKSLTTLDNLRMGTYHHYRKSPRSLIEEDLERVFTLFPILKQRQTQMAGTLSGGEQQMLAIGRGLMARPKLMMLDEPSLGLAPLVVEEIFKILTALNSMGITLLLIEQNARAALKIATRGYVMETGKITMEGKAEDLLENEHVVSAYLGG